MCFFGMPVLCVCDWPGCVSVAATAAMCVLCVCGCHGWVHVVNWSCVCVDDPGCVDFALLLHTNTLSFSHLPVCDVCPGK